jgi:hypothetical protein
LAAAAIWLALAASDAWSDAAYFEAAAFAAAAAWELAWLCDNRVAGAARR